MASAGLPDNKKTRVCSAVQTLHKIEEHKRATNKLAGPAMQVQKYAAESEIRMKTQNTKKHGTNISKLANQIFPGET